MDATAHSATPASAAGTGAAAAEIRLEGISKVYADGTVGVAELDLTFAAGELTVLVGPSGCGKTTTMKMINRLIEPSTGRILLDGEDVTRVDPDQLRRRIGYVIQSIGLFPHQTVRTNVGTVPRLLGWDKQRIREPGRRAARHRRPRPGRPRRPLPGAALRRSAAAGRRRPRAGRRPRRCCSWTSRSPPSTRSSGSGCSRSSCGCRRPCARRSSSSPTTSRRPCGSATGSR